MPEGDLTGRVPVLPTPGFVGARSVGVDDSSQGPDRPAQGAGCSRKWSRTCRARRPRRAEASSTPGGRSCA